MIAMDTLFCYGAEHGNEGDWSLKATVGLRTIRATLPGIEPTELRTMPGVSTVERHGDAITLTCTDSDSEENPSCTFVDCS